MSTEVITGTTINRIRRSAERGESLEVHDLIQPGLSIRATGRRMTWYFRFTTLKQRDDGQRVRSAKPICAVDACLDPGSMRTVVAAGHVALRGGNDPLAAVRTKLEEAPVFLSPTIHLADWKRSLAYNRRVLLDPRFGIPAGLVRRIDRAQRQFLDRRGHLIAARLRHRRIVEGHGDLRPEHIWLGDKVRIIDCLEFNPRLRVVDPFDEVAFLSLECERLDAAWVGAYIERRMKRILRDGPVEELFTFYRCHRATLRARLAIAHLLEEHLRTPEKWPRLAAAYLKLAETSARNLEALLRRRGDP